MYFLRSVTTTCLPLIALLFFATIVWGQDHTRPFISSDAAMSDATLETAVSAVSCSAESGWTPTFLAPTCGNPPCQTANCSHSSDSGRDRPWGLTGSALFPLCSCDESLACQSPTSDDSPSCGLVTLYGYDAFRGVPEGGWGTNGGHVGFNFGTRLGEFSDWSGIGVQVGGTFGVFSWAGTDYRIAHRSEAELQGFVTYGLFRKPTETSHWSAGVVQDWMLNSNFSVFAEDPTLSQLRGQLGYATSACNEFGVSGVLRVLDDTQTVKFFGPTTWRPVNHVSAYWHHKWHCGGPDTWISLGIPERTRLSGGGSLGDFLASVRAVCPFSDSVGLYASVSYMHQSASPGDEGAKDDAWNFTIGVAFYPGHNARTTTVAGQRWMPLLPVANNGRFLVDASNNY